VHFANKYHSLNVVTKSYVCVWIVFMLLLPFSLILILNVVLRLFFNLFLIRSVRFRLSAAYEGSFEFCFALGHLHGVL